MSGPAPELLRSAFLGLHGLGWALLGTVIVGALVGAAAWVALQLLADRSAWTRYALACGALVLLVALPLQAGLALHNAYGGHPQLAERIAVQLMREGSPEGGGPLPGGWTLAPLAAAVEHMHDHDNPPLLGGAAVRRVAPALAVLALLWILGAAVRLGRLGLDVRTLRRLHRLPLQPVAERWRAALARMGRRLDVSHPIRLGISDRVDGPVLIGWWAPVILIPRRVHDRLTDDEIEAVLAHELAHVRRGDYAVNLLQSVAEALLFFHPVVLWLGARLRDEREHCSDDLAQRSIGGSLSEYLRALMTLETLRGAPAPGGAMAAQGGSLLRRIRRLVEMSARTRRPRLDVDLMLAAACLLFVWVPSLAVSPLSQVGTMAVMKHELLLPRDFERIAREAGLAPAADGLRAGADTAAERGGP